jgi:hypothetical protein
VLVYSAMRDVLGQPSWEPDWAAPDRHEWRDRVGGVEARDDYGHGLTIAFSYFKDSLMAVRLRSRVPTEDVINERIVYDFCTTLLSNVNMGNLSVPDVPKPTNNVIHSVSTLEELIEVVHSGMVIFDLFPRAIMSRIQTIARSNTKVEYNCSCLKHFIDTAAHRRGATPAVSAKPAALHPHISRGCHTHYQPCDNNPQYHHHQHHYIHNPSKTH